jgi:tetratricopeptide (TPR) repeat protein
VAFDRAVTLRNAEKLIRQGKLDAAIAEYLRVVQDAPDDWNVANTLGDLYARAGQIDKAIERFIQIADSLNDEGNDEGALSKAGAIYKKILKLRPDHEHTLVQLSDILASQRRYADARFHLNALIEQRRSRGDTRGVLQVKIRLGSLDADDYQARLAAASARVEMLDVGGAVRDLKEIATELAGLGRQAEATDVLREAAKLAPDDDQIRERLLDVYIALGDFVRARECATTVAQFRMLAASLEAQGNGDEALEALRRAALLAPDDAELRTELARAFVARGDVASAAQYLSLETAGDDPTLLLTVANIHLRGDNPDGGVAIARRLLEQDGSRRDEIAMLGWNVAEQHPEAGFRVVELAADHAVLEADWPAAAAALQEFVTRVPNHVPALMRLVEICVDGGLEATMYSAQAQLADAYIAAGSATEARFIAEDLVAREPWERANIERFRRALVLLGEPDPDGVIAQRLNGESPFMSTDLWVDPPAPNEPPVESSELLAAAAAADDPIMQPAWKRPRHEDHHFELSSNAIDLESILSEEDAPPAAGMAHGASEDVEVDLSIVLDDAESDTATGGGGADAGDLDGLFGHLREEASRRSGSDESEKEYKRALVLLDARDIDGCIQALEKASRSPKLRFHAAALLGRVFRERGQMTQAIEWFERAAQAPAPTSDAAHELLYDLADGLEQVGETARALAVLIELQAEAGAYRDIGARIDRLAKVQPRG